MPTGEPMKRLIFVLSLIGLFLISGFLPLVAQADNPIVGEIRLWGGDIDNVPDGWEICAGQVLNSTTYSELYDVIGTLYGSQAGMVYLPNFQGRVVVQRDGTVGGPFANIGQIGGEISHTLTIAEMPSHNHTQTAHTHDFQFGQIAASGSNRYIISAGAGATAQSADSRQPTIQYSGGSGAHNNLQPYITLNYIIFTGVYQNPTPTPTPTDTPTATPTATATITPTATVTNVIYLPYTSSYTTTLRSGKTLTVPVYATMGQFITGGVILSLLTVFALHFLFRLVYRR